MSIVFTALNGVRLVVGRFFRFGPRSAGVCAHALAHNLLVKLRNRLAGERVACPVCGWRGHAFKALDIGHGVIPGVECPQCRAHDRHRMLHLCMGRLLEYRAMGRVLHCAPEPAVRHMLEQHATGRIVSTDISRHPLRATARPCVAADGVALPFADEAFDLLVSLHVLEHIRDDRRAIAEYFRVLRPGGLGILMAPMLSVLPCTDEWGHPDEEMFGHYRTYATRDAGDRFAPFAVSLLSPAEVLSPQEMTRYSIRPDEHIVVARK